jgi:hypothetical protein
LSADRLFGDQYIYLSCQLQDRTDWHARISSIFWTYIGAKKISQAVVFIDLVRINTDLSPSVERGFFINRNIQELALERPCHELQMLAGVGASLVLCG